MSLITFTGHADVVRLLIEKGANVFEKNNDQKTPREIASEKGETSLFLYET